MNERIEELADQAKLTVVQEMFEPEMEKFAELIVKETISEMIRQMWNYGIDESNNPAFYKAVDKTKEYFGVE